MDNKHKGKSFIVFSIDDWDDIHNMATFTRYVDSLRAMNKLEDAIDILIGTCGGKMKTMWMMGFKDFKAYVHNKDWVKDQVTCLHYVNEELQPYTQVYLLDMCSLKQVKKLGDITGRKIGATKEDFIYLPKANEILFGGLE